MKEINLLALDDEQNILRTLRALFINEPFGIVTTTDPEEALSIMEKEPIKVVLSDHRMPNMTGVEFLGKIKNKYPDVIRILFTGYADIASTEDAINIACVYRFINKPWNATDLKMTVSKAINHFDLSVENKHLVGELERKNQHLNALLEKEKEFTSTVSHELRTPLASIKMALDIIMSKTPGDLTEDQEGFLIRAKNNVDRLKRLIGDILDLTKLESGKADLKMERQNINQLITEILEVQEPVARKKGLFLKGELSDDTSEILFDKDKMYQVLDNLVSNAIKFTENGGIVILTSNKQDSNSVEICVEDTGEGIKEEDVGKLFKKFQQLGDSRNHVGGTGLGLAICKKIVQFHGGKIWVESHEGKGSRFCFVLPVEERRGRNE
ncbi:hypothetical protein MNBD_UNCLBAC01-1226 [hydrothermal vent metagenome]|uniref:histidine kinase n=1 Tax=hydrothermal vent metagenome TaxID=652676 RepID=A0A3B1CYF6_9ZZZZ